MDNINIYHDTLVDILSNMRKEQIQKDINTLTDDGLATQLSNILYIDDSASNQQYNHLIKNINRKIYELKLKYTKDVKIDYLKEIEIQETFKTLLYTRIEYKKLIALENKRQEFKKNSVKESKFVSNVKRSEKNYDIAKLVLAWVEKTLELQEKLPDKIIDKKNEIERLYVAAEARIERLNNNDIKKCCGQLLQFIKDQQSGMVEQINLGLHFSSLKDVDNKIYEKQLEVTKDTKENLSRVVNQLTPNNVEDFIEELYDEYTFLNDLEELATIDNNDKKNKIIYKDNKSLDDLFNEIALIQENIDKKKRNKNFIENLMKREDINPHNSEILRKKIKEYYYIDTNAFESLKRIKNEMGQIKEEIKTKYILKVEEKIDFCKKYMEKNSIDKNGLLQSCNVYIDIIRSNTWDINDEYIRESISCANERLNEAMGIVNSYEIKNGDKYLDTENLTTNFQQDYGPDRKSLQRRLSNVSSISNSSLNNYDNADFCVRGKSPK